ncbi:hypothetical protein TUM4438_04400 [Shewanella sairae]|uniref:GtrA/DPMS transmembrane domain-containing protein n=1 Tax=Shewanella sairae TaxID=190310 RepID=A0ABQ4P0Z0_9GAMM|nr:GtrA family protein [Shewanella sairae]MCL1128752.1 GtrA family protein [Shewanella sairae]GIU41175.1 hypothetical protein TUM4438_04400 [Shewanella sairae]
MSSKLAASAQSIAKANGPNLGDKYQAFARFLIVGAGVFVVDATLFYLLFHLFGLGLMQARSLAFATAVIVSWFINRNWTFNRRQHRPKVKQLSASILVACTAAIANLSVFYLLNFLFKPLLFSQSLLVSLSFALGVLAGLGVNWLGANYWTFSAKVTG